VEEGSTLERLAIDAEGSNFWRGHRVLVTGATGFLGSWVVQDLLSQRGQVIALILDDNPQSELIRSGTIRHVEVVSGSLEDYDCLDRAIVNFEPDTIIHLAAQAIVSVAERSPRQTFETNIRGTWNLLDSCRLHPDLVQRIVVASSDKAYGEQDHLPYTEDMPLRGRYPYEVSKSCTDLIAQSFFWTYGLPLAISRCGNIFGGGDLNWNRIVPGTIRSALRGESPIIRSDGRFIRDYIYVKDVSQALLMLGEKAACPEVRGQTFNFSPESKVTVLEIVETILRLAHREDLRPMILDKAEREIRNQYLSSERAHRVLNWKPRFSLEQGLEETLGWYRDFFGERGC
jgi:CDP-glucose 4,6-dehydratase